MLKHISYIVFIATLAIGLFSTSAFPVSEETQQEESFSNPIQKLTGQLGNIPVFSHIYGANFMTEQERCDYLIKLDGMSTKEERDAFRATHHKKIDMRRKQEGG